MKKLCALVVLTLAGVAHAQPAPQASDTKSSGNSQQERMAMCNKEATGKKGDDRKTFMSECLSSNKMTPQDRMKACNRQATGKKGDDRKAFMASCLKAG